MEQYIGPGCPSSTARERKSVKYLDIYGARDIFYSPWVSDLSSFTLLF